VCGKRSRYYRTTSPTYGARDERKGGSMNPHHHH